jgi:tRNA(His) 5'-end guanylyltransferase
MAISMQVPTPADRLGLYEVLPAQELAEGQPIVARLIGRRFEALFGGQFDRPFDPRFGKMLLKTLSHLCAQLGASYGFCERSELSLFAMSNGGEARRLLSRIGGEASAKLSLLLGEVATFEARLYQFPSTAEAWHYFRWRSEESRAAALDAWCVHVLTANGADPNSVPMILDGMEAAEKIELLREKQIDYLRVPAWQRHGASVYVAHDNGSGARLVVDLQLPATGYDEYLQQHLA